MKPDTVISFDGSWDHKRNGRYCIVDVIDQSQKKIIDFEVVQKSTNAHPSDYSGSSHNMEAHAIRNIVHRLKNDQRIIGYCHDNDSTVRKIMSTEWPIQEYLDPNHTVKSFERIFNSINKKSHNKLKGLHNHLLRFMHFLIKYKSKGLGHGFFNFMSIFEQSASTCPNPFDLYFKSLLQPCSKSSTLEKCCQSLSRKPPILFSTQKVEFFMGIFKRS